jgi:hypothetical protein
MVHGIWQQSKQAKVKLGVVWWCQRMVHLDARDLLEFDQHRDKTTASWFTSGCQFGLPGRIGVQLSSEQPTVVAEVDKVFHFYNEPEIYHRAHRVTQINLIRSQLDPSHTLRSSDPF